MLIGLWGTVVLLLLGAGFSAALGHGWSFGRLRRAAVVAGWLVGTALLARGLVLEFVLMTDAGGIASSVGPSETHWSLILWNPWFTLGGVAFLLTAHRVGKVGHTRRGSDLIG